MYTWIEKVNHKTVSSKERKLQYMLQESKVSSLSLNQETNTRRGRIPKCTYELILHLTEEAATSSTTFPKCNFSDLYFFLSFVDKISYLKKVGGLVLLLCNVTDE